MQRLVKGGNAATKSGDPKADSPTIKSSTKRTGSRGKSPTEVPSKKEAEVERLDRQVKKDDRFHEKSISNEIAGDVRAQA